MWSAEGIVLSKRTFGESKHIASVFTREMGKRAGLVRKNMHLPGDIVHAVWNGRANGLGFFTLDSSYSPFVRIHNSLPRMYALQSACMLCSMNLQDHDAQPYLFDSLRQVVLSLHTEDWLYAYMRFELTFLSEMGFGLDVSTCAVTGSSENLQYLSPKTGRAVSGEVGELYRDKIFRMPECWRQQNARDALRTSPTIDLEDVLYALEITRYFIQKHVQDDIPRARNEMMNALTDESPHES